MIASVTIKSAMCVHHWIIERTEGLNSYATCKRCGLPTVFVNPVLRAKTRDLMAEFWEPLNKPNVANSVVRHYRKLAYQGLDE